MFKSRDTICTELKKIINRQSAEIEMLKSTIVVKEKEIEFYIKRGDRYFTGLEAQEKQANELFKLAKDVLEQVINKATD